MKNDISWSDFLEGCKKENKIIFGKFIASAYEMHIG